MTGFAYKNVSGFYPSQQPVSLDSSAAVFFHGGRLFRVDRDFRETSILLDAAVSHIAQRDGGVLLLEWTPGQIAALLCYDGNLNRQARYPVFPLDSGADRNLWALTDQRVCRITPASLDRDGLADVIILDCWDYPPSASRRFAVGVWDLNAPPGTVLGFLNPGGKYTALWVHGGLAYLRLPYRLSSGGERMALLRMNLDSGTLRHLSDEAWDSGTPRPCFFDFARGLIWTENPCTFLTAREIDSGSPADGPVWKSGNAWKYLDGLRGYRLESSDGYTRLSACFPDGSQRFFRLPGNLEPDPGAPLILWRNRLLMFPLSSGSPVSLPDTPPD